MLSLMLGRVHAGLKRVCVCVYVHTTLKPSAGASSHRGLGTGWCQHRVMASSGLFSNTRAAAAVTPHWTSLILRPFLLSSGDFSTLYKIFSKKMS